MSEKNKVLIIVDMINGFINEGALADKSINNITNEIEKLVVSFLNQKQPVIAFKDCHNDNSLEFNSFPKHCLVGTNEVELIDELKKYEKDFIVYEKNSTSGFVVNEFLNYINNLENLNEVIITGCCTDICILNLAIPLKNYFNENNKNINIIVPKNAVDTYHIDDIHDKKEWNEMAFKFMNQAGVKIVEKLEMKN